jgi:CHASE2 domain-containing sensor protein
MYDFQDVFISYGRIDSKTFALKLHQRLLERGIKVWIDQNDIPLAVDYQNQINDGIEKANNFLFIISPHSVNSPYCTKEIAMAIRYHKRIIPLLHVEQISQEVWQQRNSTGTADDWKAYQAAGLHSSFPNMHPHIAKINWVYFREGIEDFEDSFAKLTAVFDRHQEYIHQHTYYLIRALDWKRQQKQPRYLLTGEPRQTAQSWLKTRFQNEQPPTLPTDLHCEYITESIKNADNWMTQVFLSYAEEDMAISVQIRQSLMRESFTVWTNWTDIHMGEVFLDEIERGIEEADNIVYLLSPHAARSLYCQRELDYALSLNKRVIPILIQKTPQELIPHQIETLQYIDLTGKLIEEILLDDNSLQAENPLIKILQDNATYFEQHKVLLAKATKWKRQNCNPSLLLRGYNLRHAEAWFQGAKNHSTYPPTALHEEFIQTSQSQPRERSLEVFISYSRVDSEFARHLNDALQYQGKTTWFDQESIASGEDFQQEIFRGIAASNNFLFILSPASVRSLYCVDEVNYARKLNKRIVPILYHRFEKADLPDALTRIQWIDFNRHKGDFLTNFGELIRTLEIDRDHARLHTRLLVQAMEWEQERKEPSYLLRGKELKDAEQWLKTAATKEPKATPLQRKYITTSRRSPLRKPHPLTVGLATLTASLLVLVARFMGWLQPLELAAYDQFMRWKPGEPKDQRLLLVEIDDDDIKAQNKRYPTGVRGGTLADPALALLLDRLESAQPHVVGLDVYRDFATDQENLARQIRQNPALVVLCQLPYGTATGIASPPELPANQIAKRLGFSDLTFDQGMTVRRQILIDQPNPPDCKTDQSFSLAIARQYLEAQGIPYRPPFTPDGTQVQPLQLGSVIVPRLLPYNAAYFNDDPPIGGGYQTMLNFRQYQGSFRQFAHRVKLQDVLDGNLPPEQIRDRIVMIGLTSRSAANDYALTPVGEMAGVTIQAQMVSQLISAALYERSLIWWWPYWGDILWIVGWASMGSLIVWSLQRPQRLTSVGILIFIAQGAISYVVFISYSGWLPVVPAAIALILAGGITLFVTNSFSK